MTVIYKSFQFFIKKCSYKLINIYVSKRMVQYDEIMTKIMMNCFVI